MGRCSCDIAIYILAHYVVFLQGQLATENLVLRRVLSRCRFAYLSTVDADCNSSHLSLCEDVN